MSSSKRQSRSATCGQTFQNMSLPLSRLFDQVLELEPWDTARHTSVCEAWEECGRQAPGYLKEGERTEPGSSVRRIVLRTGRQLNDPAAKTTWKSYPEVMRRVEDVVAKMAATRRYRDKFGPHQQHGAVESQKSTLMMSETAHASPEQPATVQQRQQQGAVEPKKSNVATAETAHASPEQPVTVQQRQQQGPEHPGVSYALQLARRSYAATAVQVCAHPTVC